MKSDRADHWMHWSRAVLAALIILGGCRSRLHQRRYVAPMDVSPPAPNMLAPPVIQESTPEVIEQGAAYGPYVPAVPPASQGFSRDMRYPQQNRSRFAPGHSALPSTQPRTIPSRPATPVRPPVEQRAAPSQPPTGTVSGVPRWRVVEANVAAGGQPTLEGFQWLKDRGFRTVLNLQPPDQTDPAEPGLVSRQLGMEYLSLAVTPAAIDAEMVEEFNRIVDDGSYRPLFIHDADGSRTGAMWYLHRILVDQKSHESARHEARMIGLMDTDTDLWLAIRSFLSRQQSP